MNKIKIIAVAIAVIIIGGLGYFGYSYYKLEQKVKADEVTQQNVIAVVNVLSTFVDKASNGQLGQYVQSLQAPK